MTGARLVAGALAAGLGLGACGGSTPRPTSRIEATDAIVRVRSEIADAGLWVDGRFIGAVGSLPGGVALDPGPHRLEIRHEAYFVHYQELDLTPGQRLTLDVELAPLLP